MLSPITRPHRMPLRTRLLWLFLPLLAMPLGIGSRRAQTGGKARRQAALQRALHGQQANGADGGGNEDTDDGGLKKDGE